MRCPGCRMVQYQTAQNRCRRCLCTLVVEAPPPPPVSEAPPRPNVAAGIRGWRRERGLTQKQLASASQLPRTYISRIENGRIIPGLVTLERVAGALGVHLPVLLSPGPNGKNGSNGNKNGSSNGNSGVAQRLASEVDACLQEILRYSGLLTGAQRQQILVRVRDMAAPRPAMSQ